MKAISIRQPWAWLIIHGTKNIENRDWYCGHKGELGIHAAKGMTRAEYDDAKGFVAEFDPILAERIPSPSELVRGALIGTVTMRGCVKDADSPWFSGRYGFLLDAPCPCAPIPMRGQLGIFEAALEGAAE